VSEGERTKLEQRLAQARRLAGQQLDALTKERIETPIRELEAKLAATAPGRAPK
jgi:hypothetical protein